VSLEPSPRATVIVGENGQGKTNLLEGLYFLMTLKPLRASKLSELVTFQHAGATVSAAFELKGARRDIAVEISAGLRQAFVDGKRAASLEDYFGGVSVVAFTPDDLDVVKGSPEGRRRFLDRAVFNRFPAFLQEGRVYARALKNRNRLLKDRGDADTLAAFDETLARSGARIWVRRRALMLELAPRVEQAFDSIGRAAHRAAVTYAPAQLPLDFTQANEETLREALRETLAQRLRRDFERGFTSVGPHADDLEILLGERSARSFASQGQQRALVLSWKIAEIENLHAAHSALPLLLLDDVSSELDPERNRFLMDYLAQSGAQVFLTTTDASLVRAAAHVDSVWFTMRKGELSPLSTG
jgi:DNA replication and repair protein RecF